MTMVSIVWAMFLGLAAQDGKSPQDEALAKLGAELEKHLKAADADGNGTLNLAEFRAFAPAITKTGLAILNELDPSIAGKKSEKDLKKYDVNADGKLDDEEKKAMEEALRKKEIKDFDWDEDGKLDEREKQAMQWAAEGKQAVVFRKVDKDANGELSAEEIVKGLSRITDIKVKKPKE
jgi:Ca2+-binding EF-hand superfamily protein